MTRSRTKPPITPPPTAALFVSPFGFLIFARFGFFSFATAGAAPGGRGLKRIAGAGARTGSSSSESNASSAERAIGAGPSSNWRS